MKIPYSCLHTCGDIVFAARAAKIHSFSLEGRKHRFTWQHPDVVSRQETEPGTSLAVVQDEGHPIKRRKLQDANDTSSARHEPHDEPSDSVKPEPQGPGAASSTPEMPKTRGKRAVKDAISGSVARIPDRPVFSQLAASIDGLHVVAVSGHDKTVWVFEHDGHGTLALVSKRTMPKRPSAVCISADSQIICADKFGDVYALPLVPSPIQPSSTPFQYPSSKSLVPAASSLTVHSKRNLEALENQRRQLELQRQKRAHDGAAAVKPDVLSFNLTLLLGHVSMLTSLALGESDGRHYILTADRDEHIRVSRYPPQAHVIENFCLGHKQFVSNILIPPSRRDVLISGGGDHHLFVWDWKAGRLLFKTNVLNLAREIAPDVANISLSGLFSLVWPSDPDNKTYILAICESIKAIFSWQLTDTNNLNNPGIIQLPANPLHLAIFAPKTAAPSLVLAQDPGLTKAKSLCSLTLTTDNGRLTSDAELSFHDEAIEADEQHVSAPEIHALLYTVSNLRKQAACCEAENVTHGASELQLQVEGAKTAREYQDI
ncbi:hypothetical protein CDD82_6070 [Ophiocordyceps australis]|uniref:Uncharacterized protein n=1 Tax=Ophiocordyceps australis TaxID=1399860 RepID=A0A2C5ZVY3_9HYPO|nr:hypothetical protein CDD82_6070 [Ophiocordyceps australis]